LVEQHCFFTHLGEQDIWGKGEAALQVQGHGGSLAENDEQKKVSLIGKLTFNYTKLRGLAGNWVCFASA
jgi:hypothetical protein